MHKLHSMSVSLLAAALYASPARSYEGDASICPSGLSGPINLPADDSVHPYSQYSDEWWYYSSHLTLDDGRELGFVQIVYTSLDPSSGAPIQYVDATISDAKTREYHFGGRQFAYSAATYVPDGFEFAIGTERVRGGNGHDVVHSEVADGSPSTYVVDLSLVSEKTPVSHLADGSIYYYSRERMRAEGTVVVDGEVHRAFGTTWFDHQFGPQLVELSTVQNWTWIAAQLGGSRELLALVVDKQDGTQEFIGSYTDADCTTTQLGAGDFTQTALGSWTENSTCTYPFGWRVTVPSKGIDVQVWPTIQNQDIWIPGMDRYYEGDSVVIGTDPGRAYVELYGFCAP